jgi:hypothetical protein
VLRYAKTFKLKVLNNLLDPALYALYFKVLEYICYCLKSYMFYNPELGSFYAIKYEKHTGRSIHMDELGI